MHGPYLTEIIVDVLYMNIDTFDRPSQLRYRLRIPSSDRIHTQRGPPAGLSAALSSERRQLVDPVYLIVRDASAGAVAPASR